MSTLTCWPTISLAVGAALLWMLFAIALGMYSALRAGKISDRLLTVLALTGISMPVFWVGALLSYYLGFKAGIFPNGGYTKLTSNPIHPAVGRAVDPVHRGLLAPGALEHPRHH